MEKDKIKNINKLEEFQSYFSPYFKTAALAMCTDTIIEQKDLPESVMNRYSNKNHTKFMVTVLPSKNIWQDLVFLDRFSEDLEKITEKATGMPIIFRTLIKVIGEDGRNALLLTVFVVYFLLLIDFKKPSDAAIAMIPLVVSMLWMLGFMKILGMKITIMNIMGLPLIVGIGIDDGVHIIHRWRLEGKGNVHKIFSSTGKAILLTTLTTMLAFGSLMFSVWRGFASLGAAMFIGVGACLLTTTLILSAVIGLTERKNK